VLCLQETELRVRISYIFDRMRFNLEFLTTFFHFWSKVLACIPNLGLIWWNWQFLDWFLWFWKQEKGVDSIKQSLIDGYENSFSTCSNAKLGYSGTAIVSRVCLSFSGSVYKFSWVIEHQIWSWIIRSSEEDDSLSDSYHKITSHYGITSQMNIEAYYNPKSFLTTQQTSMT
jgi:hypothetical protein